MAWGAATTVKVTPGDATGGVPCVALIEVVPGFSPAASPAKLMLAMFALLEAHVTPVVRACCRPLLYVPVAVNPSVCPTCMVALAGVTAMDCNVAAWMVIVAEDVWDEEVCVAVNVTVPEAENVVGGVYVAGLAVALESEPQTAGRQDEPLCASAQVIPVATLPP